MNDFATQTEQTSTTTFADLGINESLRAALERLNMAVPTDVQIKMIPHALAGRDCLTRVSTGAGKTNAYLLPILQTITPGGGMQALIIQPTRALALQLQRNIGRFSPDCEVTTAVAGGGRRRQPTSEILAAKPDILIATVRGAEDVTRHAEADWSHLRCVVIDEADAITEDTDPDLLRDIVEALPAQRQVLILAGVWTAAVEQLANTLLRDPQRLEAAAAPRTGGARQTCFEVPAGSKLDVLISYCKQERPKLAIVMLGSDDEADDILHHVERARISCRWIGQRPRSRSRDARGRSGRRPETELIFATDPAPRRLSTIPATHLIHYDLPADADTYVFRLEQAARLRRRGQVIAFVEPDQRDLLDEIERKLGAPIERAEAPKPRQRTRQRGDERRKPDARRDRDRSEPRRERGGRRESRSARPGDARSQPQAGAEAFQPRGRLNQLLYRDPELEARGIRPPRRTLGARFRTARRPRPLRRPD